jgi:hypothetical protein
MKVEYMVHGVVHETIDEPSELKPLSTLVENGMTGAGTMIDVTATKYLDTILATLIKRDAYFFETGWGEDKKLGRYFWITFNTEDNCCKVYPEGLIEDFPKEFKQ